jgi:competence protein ComEC
VASSAGSVLVAADIEVESEAQLLQRAARYNFEQVQSDVLIVPHHGSSTSSTPAFLRAVDPRIGVFTVGYRNRFGHPAPEIAARYADQGTTTYRTDLDGAVLLRFDARFEAAAWRRVRPRYWHDR